MRHLRFVVDDASLIIPDSEVPRIGRLLQQLSDQIDLCRVRQESIGVMSDFSIVECRPGMRLFELLTGADIDRDIRLRALVLLDRCIKFDAEADFYVDPDVRVDGLRLESYALAYVGLAHKGRHAVGSIPLVILVGPGPITLQSAEGTTTAHVVVDEPTRSGYYRSIYDLENVPENRFLDLARFAFPSLVFADKLSFSRFSGSYSELRPIVVEHLAAINDRFLEALRRHHGLPDRVSTDVGVDMSIEGSTRSSERLMAQRDVDYQGRTYRCEWHSKLRRNTNRIHFHPGDAGTDGHVLIGIFVDHLDT